MAATARRRRGQLACPLRRDSAPKTQSIHTTTSPHHLSWHRCYGDKPPEFLRKVPSGLLPALELDGKLYTESAIIAQVNSGRELMRNGVKTEGEAGWYAGCCLRQVGRVGGRDCAAAEEREPGCRAAGGLTCFHRLAPFPGCAGGLGVAACRVLAASCVLSGN